MIPSHDFEQYRCEHCAAIFDVRIIYQDEERSPTFCPNCGHEEIEFQKELEIT